ncbi:aminotransferase class I/II-fold pyridoxal phosphate-dependent enzyme [Candidatus Marsarchaeota archaeon]|nr:aminotransferase class I/II-fold pyridoxal phosphate-dependent enzyme [Candidatus Marsarchaeota archaeon]MCL5405046.1 aminotransferase class I/II-fold pyridoxal phosphate-dependent enzyme [Candidatus Marsarchaeota archaeon]
MDNILSKRSSWAQNSILEEAPIAEKIEAEGHKVIEINRGDPPVYFPTPKYMIDAYIRALKESKTMYSRAQGIRPLIEAIVRRYKTKYNVDLKENDIIVTAGVTEALAFVNTALINPGESAFIFRPYYNQYVTQLRLNGGIPVFDYYDENNGWDLNLDTVKAALDGLKRRGRIGRLKYMLITNPNNPTGTVLSKKVLEGIVDIANDYGIFLISDEIYDEIYYNNAKFTSISQLARGVPHMILNGASKDFDATGFRLGYAVIPEDDKKSSAIKGKMADLASVRLCVNTPAQYAFAAAMNNSKMHNREIKAMVKEIEKRVNSAVDILEENDFVHVVRPKGAFYILPRIDFKSLKIKDDREFVGKLLEEEHVMLSRGSGFGADSHVRVVALPPKNILDYAMNKINRFCKRYSK